MKRNKFLQVLALCFFSLPLFAQSERPYWYTLEQGKAFFRNGQYGQALNAFEDAKRGRRNMYATMEQNLIFIMSTTEVRRMNDSLSALEDFIQANNIESAAAALKELYFRVSRASLNDSQAAALKAMGALKTYPEAEYWIGEVYRVESELALAIKQYQKAHSEKANLADPYFDLEILYRLVDVFIMRGDYSSMEEWAARILDMDTMWGADGNSRVLYRRNAMSTLLKNGENDGMNRFLTIYRHNNAPVERAHRILGFHYYDSGRHGNAQDHLMFSFLINGTLIAEELLRNRYDFQFSTLDDMLNEAENSTVLRDFIAETEYYKTLYYLGCALYANGSAMSARSFWTVLSTRQAAAGEWAVRAANQLRSAVIERPRESL